MHLIQTEKFAGPLELLLDLIEKRKLSINEVSLSEVTVQYILYLKSLEESRPAHIASFLVIAATLMLIKSRSLLPHLTITDEEEADIHELERRLASLRKIRELSAHIKDLEARGRRMYARETVADFQPIFYPPRLLTLPDMVAIVKSLIEALPTKELLPEKTVQAVISLEEKMLELQKKTEESLAHSFKSFVEGKAEKVEVIVSFLAMLELIKQGIILVKQEGLFNDIRIERA